MLKKFKLLVLAGIAITNFAFAQVPFEGSVVYSMEIEGMEMDPTTQSMLGTMETKIFVKGDKSRTEVNMAMAKNITIADSKKKTATVLMDVMGMKYALKVGSEDMAREEEASKDIKINYIDETKEIAGYKCKKAQITNKENITVNVFYSEEIAGGSYDNKFKGLKGFPMEYEMNQNGMKMLITANEVRKEKVDDKIFEIPEGYKETTKEELQKMFGGAGK